MRRQAAKVDDNQHAIVDALRRSGVSVQSLAGVGKGCPDLLCSRAGKTYLLEVKDGAKRLSARKLTRDQCEWHSHWRGEVAVVTSVEEALVACGLKGAW